MAVVLALAVAGLCLVAVALATFGPSIGGSTLPLAAGAVEGTPVPAPNTGGGAPQVLPPTWTPSATPTGLPSVTPMSTVTLTPVVPTPAILDPPPQSEFEQVESESPLDPSVPVVEDQSIPVSADETMFARGRVVHKAHVHRALVVRHCPDVPARRVRRTVPLDQTFGNAAPGRQCHRHGDAMLAA